MRLVQRLRRVRIFLEDAAEHLAVEPQQLGVGLGGGAGQPLRVGDQRQFAEHGAGAGRADGNALAVALAEEADAPADHDIGRIGLVVLAIELAVGRQLHALRRRRRAGATVPA